MKTVTIYSTPTCAFCKALKAFLDEKGVAYTDKDVSTSDEALEEMQKYSGGSMSVPVTVYNKDLDDQEVEIGFDQDKVSATLGL